MSQVGISSHPYDGRLNPHLRRWMIFVDGENLSIRAKDFAKISGLNLRQGENYMENVFVWFPGLFATTRVINNEQVRIPLQTNATRAYYYASVSGDDNKLISVKQTLWSLGFDPAVFKKERPDIKAKGVDIALTKDMLSHAFLNNYDVAVLVAGDGDYVPLVEELKRLGKVVYIAFFEKCGLNQHLRLSSDAFLPLDDAFTRSWSS